MDFYEMTSSPPGYKQKVDWCRAALAVPAIFGLWLISTSMTDVLGRFGVYDTKRLLELGLMVLIMLIALSNIALRQRITTMVLAIPPWAAAAFLVFLLLGLVSAVRVTHPAYSFAEVGLFLMLVLTTMSVAGAYQLGPRVFERTALACIAILGLGVFAQELMAVLVYLSTGQQYNYRESLIYFLHPRMYNHVQTWTLPLLPLLPLVFSRSSHMRWLCALLIGFQWFLILATGARGSTVSLIAAMIVMAFLFKGSRSAWIKPQVYGAAIGILIYAAVFTLLNTTVPGKSNFIDESVGRPMLHTSGRVDFWKHALEDAAAHPLLGAGPMRYGCEVKHYLAGSPHNFPLQILAEWGVPAFLLLAALFLLLVKAWLGRAREIQTRTAPQAARFTCLSIAGLAALIHLNVSGLMIAPASQVAGMLVAGWLLACTILADKAAPGHAPAGYAGAGAAGLLVLGLAVASALLVFSVREQGQMQTRAPYAQDYGPITPRYWQHGKVCLYSYD